jgi:hypothetical protein
MISKRSLFGFSFLPWLVEPAEAQPIGTNTTLPGPLATAVVGQIPGSPNATTANAGNVGEYYITSLASASAIVLSTGSATAIVSLALTGGD